MSPLFPSLCWKIYSRKHKLTFWEQCADCCATVKSYSCLWTVGLSFKANHCLIIIVINGKCCNSYYNWYFTLMGVKDMSIFICMYGINDTWWHCTFSHFVENQMQPFFFFFNNSSTALSWKCKFFFIWTYNTVIRTKIFMYINRQPKMSSRTKKTKQSVRVIVNPTLITCALLVCLWQNVIAVHKLQWNNQNKSIQNPTSLVVDWCWPP